MKYFFSRYIRILFSVLAAIGGFSVLSSCEKAIDWPLESTLKPMVVVDAILTNETRTQEIKLSWSTTGLNNENQPVENAAVFVSRGTVVMPFLPCDTVPGLYKSQMPVAAAINQLYRLTVVTDTDTLQAFTWMVPVFPADQPQFRKEQGNWYSLQWNNSQYSAEEQALYEAVVTWDHLPGYNHPDSVSSARLFHFTFNTIDVSYAIFPQESEKVLFPAGAVAILTKYSLNGHFGDYIRGVVAETRWQGSLFETNRGNPMGNIEGGLGYFATCAVLRDTMVVGE